MNTERAGACPADETVRHVAEATETAMRNFAIDCAYGDQAQQKASADALRAAVRAEVSAERERCAKLCDELARAARLLDEHAARERIDAYEAAAELIRA